MTMKAHEGIRLLILHVNAAMEELRMVVSSLQDLEKVLKKRQP